MFADRLKKSLLQAAIQGQLTEQLQTDGDARDLLRKIRTKKAKLIAAKKIKAEKPLPPVTDDEIPFDIPDSWCWIRLSDVCQMYTGDSISESEKKSKYIGLANGFSYIGTKDISFDNQIDYDNGIRIPFENSFRRAFSGSVLMCIEGGSAGRKIAVTDREVCFGNKLCNFNADKVSNKYIYFYLQSPVFQKSFRDNVTGMIGGVSLRRLNLILLPLPPLAEQKRIVEKLDALLSQADKLAKDERELVELEENFPRRMRNSLLQAAIQGKLTEQLPSDGDARDLLQKIRTDKAKFVAEKKIKAEKPLPPISDDEIPFDLPDNWCWCRLGDVCNYGMNETILPVAMEKGKLLIDLEDIEKDSGKLINRKVFDGTNANSSKNTFRRRQVLFGKLRVYLNKVIIADADGYCSSEILPLDFGQNILSKYAQVVLMSPTFLSYANACSYGTKMPRLGTKAGQLALFPVPPLDEQKRIVERMKELLPLCEDFSEKTTKISSK